MPVISAFFGIIIRMYTGEHNPPHLHAQYGEFDAQFCIKTGDLVKGSMPDKKAALVKAWVLIHQEELMNNWLLLEEKLKAKKIKGLK